VVQRVSPPRGSGRKARLERRQERRQSSGFARFVLSRPRFSIPINDFVGLKEPPWADVLDSCIRRVAAGPNTGRRLAWHSVNSVGAEYFRQSQRAKDSGRSLIYLETGDRRTRGPNVERKLIPSKELEFGGVGSSSAGLIRLDGQGEPTILPLCLPDQLLTPTCAAVYQHRHLFLLRAPSSRNRS
jgi:hypothetical protein